MEPSKETLNLPVAASTFAGDVDGLYMFVLYLSIFFFVLIVGAMLLFMAQYRKRPGGPSARQISHHTGLEIAWSVIPTILVVGIFLWGVQGYMKMAVAPRGALEYQVMGKKWLWQVTSPGGKASLNELTVPVNTPIKLILSSEDVIHSFYVPAFRIKMDAVPGRYTTLWFEATQVGEFQVFCTEYCGTGHSEMLARVKVLSKEDYQQSQQAVTLSADQITPELGGQLFAGKGACKACHSLDGSRLVGPSMKGLFGKQEEIEGGSSVSVDEDYLRESIVDPMAKIVKGYPGAMPSYKGQLQEGEIGALIMYIKSVQ